MLRYRKVYFDLSLKILTIMITQVFCSVLRLAKSIVGCLKDKKIVLLPIILLQMILPVSGRELVGTTAFTMTVTFFTYQRFFRLNVYI